MFSGQENDRVFVTRTRRIAYTRGTGIDPAITGESSEENPPRGGH